MRRCEDAYLLRGSLTVEASLLVPLITLIIFAFITLMLQTHEGIQLQAGADGEADRLVMAQEAEQDPGLIDRLRCLRRVHVSKAGGTEAEALRVVYVEDYFFEKLKSDWKQRDEEGGG